MSNLDVAPAEVTGGTGGECAERTRHMPYRNVPLGGPRAMPVPRSLPQRAQSLVGAWCFVDHYGPDDVSLTGGFFFFSHRAADRLPGCSPARSSTATRRARTRWSAPAS